MGEYQVIARKWRPQKFADVIGQDHLTRTLKNAIMSNRTAHAYLLVGPRGIGKTTTARIFAKALNCTSPVEGEPCCKCRSCASIADGSSMDVIEIDAASHNLVENVRKLRDEIPYLPANSKYKVYIIDEVHMLTTQAWNALLKTIEEPPAHVKFIFATTEAHKVLPTIVSRCQRFDLKRIPARLIVERLRHITDKENVRITAAAIEAIARAADGGMRDAQSLLDQMISFFGGEEGSPISEEQALSLFGLTSVSEMESLLRALLSNDKGGVVRSIHQLSENGRNLETLFDETLSALRGILLAKILPDPDSVLEVGEETANLYRKLGEGSGVDRIQRLLETLSPAGRLLHDALNKQVFIETLMLKAMRNAYSVRIEDLVLRLNQLRKGEEFKDLDTGVIAEPPPRPVEARATAPAAPEKKTTDATIGGATPPVEKIAPATAPAPAVEKAAPAPAPVAEKAEEKPVEKPRPETDKTVEKPVEEAPPPKAATTPAPPEEEDVVEEEIPDQDPPSLEEEETEEASFEEPPMAASNAAPAPVRKATSLEKTHSAEDLLHKLAEDAETHLQDSILKSYLLEGYAESIKGDVLNIFFDEEYEREHSEKVIKDCQKLRKRLAALTGNASADIRIELRQGVLSPHDVHHQNIEAIQKARKELEKKPYVRDILDLFDGEIVDVHL